MAHALTPAVFLDRDGVILQHRDDYVKSLAEAVVMPSALTALRRLAATPYRVVIATNQSLVGRGIIPLAEAEAINQWTIDEVRRGGGRIDRVFMCPHHPDSDCACRKPRPGMLLEAAALLHIDLTRSVMIGDAVTDVQAGHAAGAQSILVRSGRGEAQSALLQSNGLNHVPVCADLEEAVQAILDGRLEQLRNSVS
jgi:D-glycero-D-manno-heptose 1,7-bisphosphate phosphatase